MQDAFGRGRHQDRLLNPYTADKIGLKTIFKVSDNDLNTTLIIVEMLLFPLNSARHMSTTYLYLSPFTPNIFSIPPMGPFPHTNHPSPLSIPLNRLLINTAQWTTVLLDKQPKTNNIYKTLSENVSNFLSCKQLALTINISKVTLAPIPLLQYYLFILQAINKRSLML